jgi:integrase
MITMWRWARAKGYLPRNIQTEMEQVEPMKEAPLKIGILSVQNFAELLRLIRDRHPTYLAVTVLAGFAGLRRAELHAQSWENIDLGRSLLRVTKAKKNTPQDRLVHLSPAAVEWLVLCRNQKGLVSPPWGIDYVRTYARDAKIECPPNAFRHSFVSYRVAATGDVRDTALEAGNSPDKIFHHYRELVSKEEGKTWFNLDPRLVDSFGAEAHLHAVNDP